MKEERISAPSSSLRISHKRARRAALASFIGAVIDWYDFLLYGIVAALVFNHQFFPTERPSIGTLAAFATFGVGFLFRPLGGMVFGHFGDLIGRKHMLMLTVLLMGGATALIGVLPTYNQVGVLAPVLLVLLRAIQGFAVGGEWGGAALMAVESAPKKRRAFYSSGVQIGYGVGLMLATGGVSLLNGLLDDQAFMSWGWRLPFLFSIVLVYIGYRLRSRVEESPEFEKQKQLQSLNSVKKPRIPLMAAVRQHPGAFLLIIAMRLAEMFTMYIVTTFALSYSTVHLGLPRQMFLTIGLLVGAISCISIPLFALLADRVGQRKVYATGALIGIIFATPFFQALQSGHVVLIFICAIMLANVAHDMVVCVHQRVFTELFGAAYRYSGAGVGYQVASVVGGGFTPFIAAALVAAWDGAWWPVAVYLMLGCSLSLLASFWIKRN